MFRSVIAAIDGTRASFEAGRQAARLTAPGGELMLLAVADPYMAASNRWGPGALVQPGEVDDTEALALARRRMDERARASLSAMRTQFPDGLRVAERVATGRPWVTLREVAAAEGADLVVTGAHGAGRLAGIALGSTATEMLHEAPCSVMVARTPFDPSRFPATVVVGVDGSPHSIAALDTARGLATTAIGGGTSVRVVAARSSGLTAEGLARLAEPLDAEVRADRPVAALVDAAASADLLIVGARGLTGLRALGSVAERVAHRAESSVLVVATRS